MPACTVQIITMKKYRNLSFYVLTIAGFSALIWFIIHRGEKLESGTAAYRQPKADGSSWDQFQQTYSDNLTHPLAILLLQIITIIVVARVFGYLCRKIRQPSVIGEIIAGIFLGPSFIGTYFPEFSAFLFPAKSLPNLQFLSQIGLILFMFVVGMELDLKVLRNKAKDAIVVSHASIIFPFALGITLAYYIYTEFAPPGIRFLSFSLFTGIAMSITAFPVLARIVQERGLSKTRLGTVAITCAAADDITAWCILAAVIAIVKAGSIYSSVYTILMAGAYVVIMLKVVQPFLKKLGEKYSNRESLGKPAVAIFFIILLISSYATEVIGIHALFGAFMAGVIMPATINFRNIFIEKVEDVSMVLLLPLFFVFTGLRTEIGLLNDPYLWKICGLIILVAVVGKFVGSALAARFVGQSWKDSLALGALMNTRGLMELIVLNIGYDLGVMTKEVFAMMVIMALVTTFMTGPALDLINRFSRSKSADDSAVPPEKPRTYNVLVSFSTPEKGIALLKLANSLIRKNIAQASVTALHLSSSAELNAFNQAEVEKENFEPISQEAERLNLPVANLFKPTSDIEGEIIGTANSGEYDLLLVGAGHSVFEGTLLGKLLGFTNRIINPERLYDTITGKEGLFETAVFDERIRQITRGTKVPVGIFLDKGMEKVNRIYIPFFALSDSFLLIYAQKLMHNSEALVTVQDASGIIAQNPEISHTITSVEQELSGRIQIAGDQTITEAQLGQQDLMLISFESWKKAVEAQSEWLSHSPSVLVIKP